MKRVIAPLSLLLLVALAGCSSTPSTGAASASPAQTAVASSPVETAPPSASETTSPSDAPTMPSEAPTSAPVAGGTATDFCGAFKELQAISDSSAGDLASAGAQFQAAAADIRKFAPAEIASAANTYADVMDNIGKAIAGGTLDEAGLSKALADGIAGNAKDIGTTAVWVAKNCNL